MSFQPPKLTQEQQQFLKLIGENRPKNKVANKRTSYVPTPFSLKQIKTLFDNITNVKLALICYFSLRFGLRRKEILSLNVEDIDWNLKRIVLKKGKTGLPHTFHLEKFDINLLTKYLSLLNYDQGPLFPSQQKKLKPMHEVSLSNEFRKSLKKCNLLIPNKTKVAHRKKYVFTFHNLRTTFISLLCNSLDDIFLVQNLARHTSIKTTLKYYAYCGSSKMKKAISQTFFDNGQKKKGNSNDFFEVADLPTKYEEDISKQNLPNVDALGFLEMEFVKGNISEEDFLNKKNTILKSRL